MPRAKGFSTHVALGRIRGVTIILAVGNAHSQMSDNKNTIAQVYNGFLMLNYLFRDLGMKNNAPQSFGYVFYN
jgi:hypothetical protein